jgi:hypothetical protein
MGEGRVLVVFRHNDLFFQGDQNGNLINNGDRRFVWSLSTCATLSHDSHGDHSAKVLIVPVNIAIPTVPLQFICFPFSGIWYTYSVCPESRSDRPVASNAPSADWTSLAELPIFRRNLVSVLVYIAICSTYLCLYSLSLGLGRFFSFLIFYTVGMTPWKRISPSQGRHLHTGQHKHSMNTHTDIHTSSWIPVSGRAKTVHALDRAATVVGTI